MSEHATVRVDKDYRIEVPPDAREKLNIRQGDHLLVDIQDGLLILLPQPTSYTDRLAGLHREVWAGVDTDAYLRAERESWESSRTD